MEHMEKYGKIHGKYGKKYENIWGTMGKSMEDMETSEKKGNISMGDLQDPKMEILYHFSGHFLWGYSLT